MIQKGFKSSKTHKKTPQKIVGVQCVLFLLVLWSELTVYLGCSQCPSRSLSHWPAVWTPASCVTALPTLGRWRFSLLLSRSVGLQRQQFRGAHTHACTHNHHTHRHINMLLCIPSIIFNTKLSPWEVLSKYLVAFFLAQALESSTYKYYIHIYPENMERDSINCF